MTNRNPPPVSLKARQKQVEEVLTCLGGPTAAARLVGVGPSAASNWLRVGRFPARTYVQMLALLRAAKVDPLPPMALWGMRDHDPGRGKK